MVAAVQPRKQNKVFEEESVILKSGRRVCKSVAKILKLMSFFSSVASMRRMILISVRCKRWTENQKKPMLVAAL